MNNALTYLRYHPLFYTFITQLQRTAFFNEDGELNTQEPPIREHIALNGLSDEDINEDYQGLSLLRCIASGTYLFERLREDDDPLYSTAIDNEDYQSENFIDIALRAFSWAMDKCDYGIHTAPTQLFLGNATKFHPRYVTFIDDRLDVTSFYMDTSYSNDECATWCLCPIRQLTLSISAHGFSVDCYSDREMSTWCSTWFLSQNLDELLVYLDKFCLRPTPQTRAFMIEQLTRVLLTTWDGISVEDFINDQTNLTADYCDNGVWTIESTTVDVDGLKPLLIEQLEAMPLVILSQLQSTYCPRDEYCQLT
jgi:hypothetical protein